MKNKVRGHLLIIGGNEDKSGECCILRKFIELAGGRQAKIAILTTASEVPAELGDVYHTLFTDMGAQSAEILYIADRQSANDRHQAEKIDKASAIFLTGGDQLRLTSILGGSAVDEAIRRACEREKIIAGTSAGASVMSDTMIVDGNSSDTPKKSTINMAHGMGLLEKTVIDQHFAQRGRINRLLAAVAQNPYILGIGIDEDTALVVRPDDKCEIIGSQTVTILDGKNIVYSNISESKHNDPLALTNVLLHILPAGMGFDLKRRMPCLGFKSEEVDS